MAEGADLRLLAGHLAGRSLQRGDPRMLRVDLTRPQPQPAGTHRDHLVLEPDLAVLGFELAQEPVDVLADLGQRDAVRRQHG